MKRNLLVKTLVAILINFYSEGIEEYDEIIYSLTKKDSYSYSPRNFDLYLMNRPGEVIEEYDETICALTKMDSYSYSPKNLDLYLKNRPTPSAKSFIEEPSVLELKELLSHL